MSTDQLTNQNEQQRRIIKYILDKFEIYAHKSHLWRLMHASHIRRNLLRRSRCFSKIHSISEDFVRQCINQLLTDVDQYVTQLHRIVYLQQFDDLLPLFYCPKKKNTAWCAMQLERARHVLETSQPQSDDELLDNYYAYVKKKLTPNYDSLDTNRTAQVRRETSFDLNLAYEKAEREGQNYLKDVLQDFRAKRMPDLGILNELVKLGEYIRSNSSIV
jgi:hypothetical protein